MIPLCKNIHVEPDSTWYCGLNYHTELKRKWDEHISKSETYDLDYTLVNKFRNLWSEWVSIIQKQR